MDLSFLESQIDLSNFLKRFQLIHSSADWVSSLGRGALDVDGVFMCPHFIDDAGKTPQTEVNMPAKNNLCEED